MARAQGVTATAVHPCVSGPYPYLCRYRNQLQTGLFSLLYNAGLRAYKMLVWAAAPVNAKARQWTVGQHQLLTRIASALPNRATPNRQLLAWFHAASLGEFEQGRPVIDAFRAQYPNYLILLTFFSPSGYEVRKDYAGADFVCYLPLDTPPNARRFMDTVQPAIAFFVKYEFWANYLRELQTRQVPTVLFSALFRPNQLFFKPYGGFYRNLLTCFSHILVQNQESIDLLEGISVTRVTLAGDTRFDRVVQTAVAAPAIPIAESFKAGMPLLVVGSAWPEDMVVLIPFLNTFDRPLRVIIAPHEIHPDEISRWQAQLQHPSIRYSELNEAAPHGKWPNEQTATPDTQTLFIDNVGMLSALYQYAAFAFIGGAFKQGLHNVLEAATFGMPVFFGPDYAAFPEAGDLIGDGAGFAVGSVAELTDVFARQYADPAAAARASRAYVQRNVGATAQVMQTVQSLLSR